MNMINKTVTNKMAEKIQDSIKPVKMVDTETPQQKQAAAKLALRKQLEKTLLQVMKNLMNTTKIEVAKK
jgi:hypothetical protein